MGANQIKKKYNEEYEVIVNIILDKVCYFPSEMISGFLELQPKYNLNQTIFNDTKVIFKIAQFQEYSYTTGSGDNESTEYVCEYSNVLKQETSFNYFSGANILLGVKITFSILIPLEIQPTFYYKRNFIKHFFCVELPGIKAKRALIIIIKGFQFFTKENKLLRIPTFGFGDFYKNQNGKVSCLIEFPKNSFIYTEPISFKINLNCSESNIGVKALKISITKFIYFNKKVEHKKHFIIYLKKEIAKKEFTAKENLTKYEINGHLNLPFDFSNSQEIYSTCERYKMMEVDWFSKIKKRINFKPLIQIYNNNKDNYLNNEANNNSYNINYIDNYDNKNNNENKGDFEIIEHDDFQKAFFGNNKQ